MNILAFGASNNRQSINRTLATHAAHLVEVARVKVIDIADYEMPLFSDEREQALGQPLQARSFFEEIASADAIVVSFAEHNGSYTAAYKNLFDWTSRISQKVFQGKPVVYLSTSPGPGGAGSVLASAIASAPFFGADVIASLSVPSFQNNFNLEQNQWVNPEIRQALETVMEQLADAVHRDCKAA
jgi:chromate reductase, NAD(P)H dehydrogenase (quinone)